VKNVQKGYGISAAGDAHKNPVSLVYHFLAVNGVRNCGYQGMGYFIILWGHGYYQTLFWEHLCGRL
jgi:hypothetical protein